MFKYITSGIIIIVIDMNQSSMIRYVGAPPYVLPSHQPYGLFYARETRVNLLSESIFNGIRIAVGAASFVGGAIYLPCHLGMKEIKDIFAYGICGGALSVSLIGLVAGVVCGLPSQAIAKRIVRREEAGYPGFFDDYASYLKKYIKTGNIPENLPKHFAEGLKIDSIPHFMENSELDNLEKVILEIDNSSVTSFGIFSSENLPTYVDYAYNLLSGLIIEKDNPTEEFKHLITDRPSTSLSLQRSVGMHLIRDYEAEGLQEDADSIRALIGL